MIHSDCHVTIPELSEEELYAMGKCKIIQVLLPSYIDTCKKFIKGTQFTAIGNAVEPVVKFAECYKGKKHIR